MGEELKKRKGAGKSEDSNGKAAVSNGDAHDAASTFQGGAAGVQPISQKYWRTSLIAICIIAFLTRVWGISHPAEVVFDEVHFGKFASYYLERTYYFDVHPPLGKLLFAAVGLFLGYDGHFHFDKIGDDYVSNGVPYVGLRLFPALLGAAVIPLCFLTLKEIGVSLPAAIFGAALLLLDNSLIAQSRLILLDSMLMLFCIMSTYAWIRFYKLRHQPFQFDWWLWLSLTGVCLSLTTGVKLVGLFVVATVGIATLCDLWDLLDIGKGLSMTQFMRHFAARALCLIVLPVTLYLSFFYIHFWVLNRSGPGDSFMSSTFQAELIGNEITAMSSAIPYLSNITIRHRDSASFLHSHIDRYPLRYEDDRVSSQGQQVTAYPHRDVNNLFIVEPVDPEKRPPVYELTKEEQERKVRYVRNGDLVRLRHAFTDSYLITHDVASPLTTTNMEVTTWPAADATRYEETIWRLENTRGEDGNKLMTRKDTIRVVNDFHKVALFTSKKSILPKWGFDQQEINGNKNVKEPTNLWFVDEVQHERIINGTEVGEKQTDANKIPKMSFFSKFFELQDLMISHNAGLTKPHPYSSGPGGWPFVLRGISFWEKKEGLKQIYLLGNPIVWWMSITATMMYAAMWVLDRTLLQRGIDDFGGLRRRWFHRSIGFLFVAWALHWFPFFLMGRMLFLHHYLPSMIFSTMITAAVFDFVGRLLGQDYSRFKGRLNVPMTQWMSGEVGFMYSFCLLVLGALSLICFFYFSPLTYGTGFDTIEELRARKWLESWDLQHA